MTEADLREALEQARQENRRKDQLIAMLAHDLRGPLSTLLLWEMVLRAPADDTTRLKALEAIRRSASAQSALIAHLVDLVRLTRGELRIAKLPVEIGALLADALERRTPMAAARNLAFDTHIATDLGLTLGEPERIHQILACVLTNLISLASPRHSLVVTARSSSDTITIEATACAPDAELASATSDEPPPGGLELALVCELTNQLGGVLTVLRSKNSDGFGFKLSLCRFRKIPDSAFVSAETMDEDAHRNRGTRAGVGGRRRRRGTQRSARE